MFELIKRLLIIRHGNSVGKIMFHQVIIPFCEADTAAWGFKIKYIIIMDNKKINKNFFMLKYMFRRV